MTKMMSIKDFDPEEGIKQVEAEWAKMRPLPKPPWKTRIERVAYDYRCGIIDRGEALREVEKEIRNRLPDCVHRRAIFEILKPAE